MDTQRNKIDFLLFHDVPTFNYPCLGIFILETYGFRETYIYIYIIVSKKVTINHLYVIYVGMV